MVSGIGNHVLIVIMIGILAMGIIKIKCGKIFQWKNFSSLRSGILYAALFVVFAIAVHELLWYLTYFLMGFPNPIFILSSIMFGGGIAALLVNFFVRKFTMADFTVFLGMSLFYLAWAVGGFHVTVGFAGNTQYLMDAFTNLLENLSWAFLVTLAFLQYKLEGPVKP